MLDCNKRPPARKPIWSTGGPRSPPPKSSWPTAVRTLSHRGVAIAQATARLEQAQTQLAELDGQIDHALLAKEAGELNERRDALAQEVAALDQEIERKGPLAESAMTLNTEVAGLEDQLLRLTREREQAAAAVREAERELELVNADRDQAEREHARLAEAMDSLAPARPRLRGPGLAERRRPSPGVGVRHARGAEEGAGLPARADRRHAR